MRSHVPSARTAQLAAPGGSPRESSGDRRRPRHARFIGLLAAGLVAATLTGTGSRALAATGPGFDYTPTAGPVGTKIDVTNGGCTSTQTGGDALALYRQADGAVV